MATFYLDFENGNDSNDGLSFANRWKTITSGATAARTAPGDVIRIMKSPDPVSLGVNGTFTKQSPTITLASAVTANISLCQAAWTASANVTTTTSSTRKEGTLSTSIAPAAAFTTGLLAYEATGTLNLSAYQNVTFWIWSSTTIAANSLRLDLCSDAAGATPVNSFTINYALSTGATATWHPVTFKNGAALGSSIQSVALTALTDFGATTILLDNIIATNNLHFNSLIGTSSSATNQVWYPIRSINNTTIIMGNEQSQGATGTHRGWHDTTTTTLVYVRDTITLSQIQTINESGTNSAFITYSGGWDRANMSTQDGLTYVGSSRANYTNAFTNTRTNITFERLNVLYGQAFNGSGDRCRLFKCGGYGCLNVAYSLSSTLYLEDFYQISNGGGFSQSVAMNVKNLFVYSNDSGGINMSTNLLRINTANISNNSGVGLYVNSSCIAQNLTIKDNASSIIDNRGYLQIDGLKHSGNAAGITSSSGVAKISNIDNTITTSTNPPNGFVSFSRYPLFAGYVYSNGAVVTSDVNTPLHGSTSRSWSHTPTSAHDTYIPVIQPLQPFAVNPSTLVTFSIWVYRTSTNVEGRIRLRGYVTPGVDADVTSTITAAINTWQELTVTCTPSAAGVVQIDLESYSVNGGTGTVYFGDASLTQA